MYLKIASAKLNSELSQLLLVIVQKPRSAIVLRWELWAIKWAAFWRFSWYHNRVCLVAILLQNPNSSRIESASADPTLEMGDAFGFALTLSRLRIWSNLESSVPSPAITWHLKSTSVHCCVCIGTMVMCHTEKHKTTQQSSTEWLYSYMTTRY